MKYMCRLVWILTVLLCTLQHRIRAPDHRPFVLVPVRVRRHPKRVAAGAGAGAVGARDRDLPSGVGVRNTTVRDRRFEILTALRSVAHRNAATSATRVIRAIHAWIHATREICGTRAILAILVIPAIHGMVVVIRDAIASATAMRQAVAMAVTIAIHVRRIVI